MTTFRVVLCITAVASMVGACGGGSNTSDADVSSASQNAPAAAQASNGGTQQVSTQSQQVVTKQMMQGRWLGGCEAESDGTGYGLTTEYKDTEIAVWGGQFGDSTCSSLIFEVGLIGKYSLGSTLITENGTAATELDYVVNQLVMRPSSHDFATKMNQTSYCGLTNWSAGVSQEITGCSEFKPTSNNYDLVQFDGSAHFLGARSESRDASSKDKRPTTIDYSTKFVRASANDPIHQDDSSNAISRGTTRELLELYLKKLRMFNWGGFGISNR